MLSQVFRPFLQQQLSISIDSHFMLIEPENNTENQPQQHLTLQLIDPTTFLIANFHSKLNTEVQNLYQLVPSFKHNGYAAKIKMLNSLRRDKFQQTGCSLPQLPSIALKMFKTAQAPSLNLYQLKRHENYYAQTKLIRGSPFMPGISPKNIKPNYNGSKVPWFMHIGRWVLTPHQKRAIQYFLKRGKRMILGDEWNMGKTVTSLACLHYSKCKKTLVIVPKILIKHWTWHIQQMAHSLSKQNTTLQFVSQSVNPQVKIEKISSVGDKILRIQILDNCQYQQHNASPSPSSSPSISSNSSSIKQQQAKPEVKLKQQEQQTPIHYTLCSYEYVVKNLSIFNQRMIKQYNGLILDELQVNTQDGNSSVSESLEHVLKQLRKIQNVVICRSSPIEKTRDLLPVVNPNVEWSEIAKRYGFNSEKIRNQFEYINSVGWCYYFGTKAQDAKAPGWLIKPLILTVNTNQATFNMKEESSDYNDSRMNIRNECIGKNLSSIQQIAHTKLRASIDYISYIKNNPNYKQIYLICYHEENAHVLGNLLQYSNETQQIRQNYELSTQENKTRIKIGSLQNVIRYLVATSKNKKHSVGKSSQISIICDVFNVDQTKYHRIDEQLLTLYSLTRIQYIQLFQTNPHSQRISHLQSTIAGIYKPYISPSSYIDKICQQEMQISSDQDSGKKKKNLNPQRYMQSQSSQESKNEKMIDEAEEIKQAAKNKYYLSIDLEDDESENEDVCVEQISYNAYRARGKQIGYKQVIEIESDRAESNRFQSNRIQLKFDQRNQLIFSSEDGNYNPINAHESKMDIQSSFKQNIEKSIVMDQQSMEDNEQKQKQSIQKCAQKKMKNKEIKTKKWQQTANEEINRRQTRQSKRKKLAQSIVETKSSTNGMDKNQPKKSRKKQYDKIEAQQNTNSQARVSTRRTKFCKQLQKQKEVEEQKKNQHMNGFSTSSKIKQVNRKLQSPPKLQLREENKKIIDKEAGHSSVTQEVFEIFSDEDNEHTMMVTPKHVKVRPKQVLQVKLIPKRTSLIFNHLSTFDNKKQQL